jgi:membrane protein
VGLFGLVGFAWSASNAFSMLIDNINQAFPDAEIRSFLRKRLAAFGILGVIVVILILTMFSSTLLSLLSQFKIPILGNVNFYSSTTWSLITQVTPLIITFILFINLYRWVPNSEISWKAAFWSALTVTVLWETASTGFRWYLSSGLSDFELVYGSLSTIVVLMLWIYLSSLIIFLGAHFCAAITGYMNKNRNNE